MPNCISVNCVNYLAVIKPGRLIKRINLEMTPVTAVGQEPFSWFLSLVSGIMCIWETYSSLQNSFGNLKHIREMSRKQTYQSLRWRPTDIILPQQEIPLHGNLPPRSSTSSSPSSACLFPRTLHIQSQASSAFQLMLQYAKNRFVGSGCLVQHSFLSCISQPDDPWRLTRKAWWSSVRVFPLFVLTPANQG